MTRLLGKLANCPLFWNDHIIPVCAIPLEYAGKTDAPGSTILSIGCVPAVPTV